MLAYLALEFQAKFKAVTDCDSQLFLYSLLEKSFDMTKRRTSIDMMYYIVTFSHFLSSKTNPIFKNNMSVMVFGI